MTLRQLSNHVVIVLSAPDGFLPSDCFETSVSVPIPPSLNRPPNLAGMPPVMVNTIEASVSSV